MPCRCQTGDLSGLNRVSMKTAPANPVAAACGCLPRAADRGRRCRTTRRESGRHRRARACAARPRSSRADPVDSLPRGTLDEARVIALVEVGGGGAERRGRVLGLLDEADDPVVLVDFDDAVLLRQLAIADVEHRDRAATFFPPPCLIVAERIVEEVVAGNDEQVVVQADELDVSDRTEPVLVRGRPVVVDLDVLVLGPALEVCREARVRHVDGPRRRSSPRCGRGSSRPSAARRRAAAASGSSRSAAGAASHTPRRGSAPSYEGRERACVGRTVHAVLGHDRGDQRSRRDVERRIPSGESAS